MSPKGLVRSDHVTNSRQDSVGHGTGGGAPSFGLWADPVLSLALLALWIALALVFNGEPEIDQRDLVACSLPCSPARKGRRRAPAAFSRRPPTLRWQALRNFFHYLPVVVAIVVAAILARDLAAGRRLADGRVRFTDDGARGLSRRPGPRRERLPQGILGPAAAGLDRPVRRPAAVRAGRRNGPTPVPPTAPSCRARRRRSSGWSASFRYGRGVSAAGRRWQSRRSALLHRRPEGGVRRPLPLRRRARRAFDADRVRRAGGAGRSASLQAARAAVKARACGRSPSC